MAVVESYYPSNFWLVKLTKLSQYLLGNSKNMSFLLLFSFAPQPAMKFRNCQHKAIALAVLCTSGLATVSSASASSFSYTVTDLGKFPGGSYSDAYGLNDLGEVVGDAELPKASPIGSGSHAFFYDGGALQDLGTLPGDNYSGASAINNDGEIVGTSSPSSGGNHAFLYSDGALQNLGTLPGGSYSIANGINDQGQVVGSGNTAPGANSIYGDNHAVLYGGKGFQDIGTLPKMNSVIKWTALNNMPFYGCQQIS